ncbi:hypothetical protein PALU110988_18780 [Paenibacillus lupini]|uniref:hypothetical protein n=1 Tax=Paenibacillus lupini TaxID=1450204 RepID=UPI001423B4FB|nr:hypothetical protein [Paenibacillus lupini]NIK24235.1 hypothetical protein [Paenibacillus lupini]
MSGGAFQTSRELFANPIWQNIVEFRLFFLIYGSAVFAEDGVKITDDLTLKRGQWLRSTRKLQEDLKYIENRQVLTYSVSTINRTIKRLERLQRICTKQHQLGTVFTVLNYEQYQGFGNYKHTELGTELGTNAEQTRNNNKNVYKGKEGSLNNSSSQNKKITYSEDDDFYLMALYLHVKIMDHAEINGKKHLVENADMQKWADEFRKIIVLDKRNKKELKEIIDWCTSDTFWQVNILSPKKLREKYAELGLKMNQPSGGKQMTTRPMSKAEKNKQLLQRKMKEAQELEQAGGNEAPLDLFSSLPYGGDQ